MPPSEEDDTKNIEDCLNDWLCRWGVYSVVMGSVGIFSHGPEQKPLIINCMVCIIVYVAKRLASILYEDEIRATAVERNTLFK